MNDVVHRSSRLSRGVVAALAAGLATLVAAAPSPTHVARLGIDPAGPITALAASGDLIAWNQGRELIVARLASDGQAAIQGSVLLPATASALTASGRMVFAATTDGVAWVDVTDPARPSIVAVRGVRAWLVGIAAGDGALVLAYRDLLTVDPIDGSGVPILPRSWRPPARINDLAVSGTTAIVGHDDGFDVIDIADPGAPRRLGGATTPDPVGGVAIDGSLAVVAVDAAAPMAVVDLTHPAEPAVLGTFEPPWPSGRLLSLVGRTLVVTGSYCAVAVDLADATAPEVGECIDVPAPISTALATAVVSSDGFDLWRIEPSGGTQLTVSLAAATDAPGTIRLLTALATGELVTANAGRGGTIVRAMSPSGGATLTEIGRVNLPGEPEALLHDDDVVVVVHGDTLTTLQLTDSGLAARGSLELGGHDGHFAMAGDTVWFSYGPAPIAAVDLSNPAAPFVARRISLGQRDLGCVDGLDASGDRLIATVMHIPFTWYPRPSIPVSSSTGTPLLHVVAEATTPSRAHQLARLPLERLRTVTEPYGDDVLIAAVRDGRRVVERFAISDDGRSTLVARYEPEPVVFVREMYPFGATVLAPQGPYPGGLWFVIPVAPGYSRVQFTTPRCSSGYDVMTTAFPYLAVQCDDNAAELYQAIEPPS